MTSAASRVMGESRWLRQVLGARAWQPLLLPSIAAHPAGVRATSVLYAAWHAEWPMNCDIHLQCPRSFASLFNPKDINLMACLEGGHPLLVVAAGGWSMCRRLIFCSCRRLYCPHLTAASSRLRRAFSKRRACAMPFPFFSQACAASRRCGQRSAGHRCWRTRAAAVWCALGWAGCQPLPWLPISLLILPP